MSEYVIHITQLDPENGRRVIGREKVRVRARNARSAIEKYVDGLHPGDRGTWGVFPLRSHGRFGRHGEIHGSYAVGEMEVKLVINQGV